MNTVHTFVAELTKLFNAVAGIPGPELSFFIKTAVSVLIGFGVLHVANANAFATEVYGIVAILLAAGLAIEKTLNGAANYRASFAATKPASK